MTAWFLLVLVRSAVTDSSMSHPSSMLRSSSSVVVAAAGSPAKVQKVARGCSAAWRRRGPMSTVAIPSIAAGSP
eukprot:6687085-Pyramimonas_sp.AAC.1